MEVPLVPIELLEVLDGAVVRFGDERMVRIEVDRRGPRSDAATDDGVDLRSPVSLKTMVVHFLSYADLMIVLLPPPLRTPLLAFKSNSQCGDESHLARSWAATALTR